MDVMSQSAHWDDATTAVVAARLGVPPDIRFFTPDEEGTASAVFDCLLDQREDPRVPVVQLVDARLAEQQTDGWHYEDMPPDGEAWRSSLGALEEDTRERFNGGFADATWEIQEAQLQTLRRTSGLWHGLPAPRLWSLWTRYACTAFYSHPWAWDEIGFAGPAYPRGYKHLGLDAREPFEVADTFPGRHPTGRHGS